MNQKQVINRVLDRQTMRPKTISMYDDKKIVIVDNDRLRKGALVGYCDKCDDFLILDCHINKEDLCEKCFEKYIKGKENESFKK